MSANEHVERELAPYHFGLATDEERRAIEAHLLECRECLRAFFELKRGVETAEGEARPPALARAKLRRAVAAELGVLRPRAWWERPVAFAVAASVVLAAGSVTRAITSGPGAPPYAVAHVEHR